jgi:protein TonB
MTFLLSHQKKITEPKKSGLLEEKYTTNSPRRKFIGRTNSYHYALYIEKFRQLIEKNASNSDTLKELRNIGAYGKVQLIISLKSDGSIYNIETNESSGNLRLDETFINLIEQSSPFDKFSNEMIKDADVISFVRTFSFSLE